MVRQGDGLWRTLLSPTLSGGMTLLLCTLGMWPLLLPSSHLLKHSTCLNI